MGDVLFLVHRAPFPPDRGDKIRAYHILKYIAARTRVHLIAFGETKEDMTADDGLRAMVVHSTIIERTKSNARAAIEGLITGAPASVAAFKDRRMVEAVAALLATESIDTIYVYSSQMAQYVPNDFGGRLVMDFVDVDSDKFADYARREHGPKRWLYTREARTLLQFDRAVAKRADASLFVSDAEAALFRIRSGAPRVHAVENGIDTVTFDPDARFDRIPAAGPLLVFTGQMDYAPNIEAVRWFVGDILPLVREHHAGVCFAIVGRNPSDAVVALANTPGVTVTGVVPDVRGWLAAADVVVAPLKLARGIQNKVLEAMAMARPVVASEAAAEGIDHADTIRVGRDESEVAAMIIALLGDRADAATLGASARARVQARYGWDARLAVLDQIIGLPGSIARVAA